jgi:Ca-activated chloride channel family protein
MFRFAHPEFLLLLLIVPALTAMYLLFLRRNRRILRRFGSAAMVKLLSPQVSPVRRNIKLSLWLLAFSFFALGLSRPQLGARVKEVTKKGVEIIIALDVSNSMMAQDFTPNRLENAKRAIARLVEQLSGDRIGLIVFAGDAYIQLPITSDYVSAKSFLSSISPAIVARQGTAIGKAITTAIRSFSLQSDKSRAIIIISDGENHDDNPIEAAELAAKEGIKIYAIGVGSGSGSPIPLQEGGMMKDSEGNIVVTRLDEVSLQEIASTGKGIYVRASNANFGFSEIIADIRKMEKQELSSIIYEDFNEQYGYFFVIALVLLLLEMLIVERKNGWLSAMQVK